MTNDGQDTRDADGQACQSIRLASSSTLRPPHSARRALVRQHGSTSHRPLKRMRLEVERMSSRPPTYLTQAGSPRFACVTGSSDFSGV